MDEFIVSQRDLLGLPPSLLTELSKVGRAGGLPAEDQLLIEIIDSLGGAASIDQVLVAVFRRSGEVMKRTIVNARLYRLTKREVLFDHPSVKGVFCTREIKE